MREGKFIRRRLPTAIAVLGILPIAAFAQLEETPERRAACMADAILLCSSALPNKARIATCLASKMDQLTPRCRAQFAKHQRPR
jgi:hypothetical protein